MGSVNWATALTNIGKSTDTANTSLNSGKDFTCSGYTAGTFTDWRLPNLRELQSLIDYQNSVPALPSGYAGFFTGVSSNYWSATTYAANALYAWFVILDIGDVGYIGKTTNIYVWPVR